MNLSRHGIIKLCSAAVLLPISSSSFAQIVIGPATPQQVPVMSPLMTITLASLMLFVVAKLLKDKGFGKSALTIGGIGLLAAISATGYQWAPAAQAGSIIDTSLTNSSSTQSYPLLGIRTVFENNSGVTLKVISITGCPAPAPGGVEQLCTVDLTLATSAKCQLSCL